MVDLEPVSTAQARTAWHVGVAPLLDAFPTHAGAIIRAIAFAHRDPFPVPIFITGRDGAGKSTLARAIGELTGQAEPLELPQMTLASIKKAARPGEPLIVDDAALLQSRARPPMFTQIQGEVYVSRHSPLHASSIIVATGEQKVDPISAPRVLLARINRRRADREIFAQLHSDTAAASRRTVHHYLQSQIPRITLAHPDAAARAIALNDYLAHERRRDAALHVGTRLLRSLDLDAGPNTRTWLHDDDRITTGVQAALRYALDNGASFAGDLVTTDWILGRRDDDHLYVIPSELMPFLRAELNDENLTTNAAAAALERSNYLYRSTKQGRSIPKSINGTLTRVWRLNLAILD